MTEEKKELTFTFDEDGKEYKVEDLSDENKILYNKVTLVNKQRQEVIANANFEVEKLEILANITATH